MNAINAQLPTIGLTIGGKGIRMDSEGRYCLNDCHRAAGGLEKDKPARFLRLDSTEALIAEISQVPDMVFGGKQPISVTRGGNFPGTYACKEIIYAYAMWISPMFHLTVIRAFDAMVTGQVVAPQPSFQLPQTFSEALRALADQSERNEALVAENT